MAMGLTVSGPASATPAPVTATATATQQRPADNPTTSLPVISCAQLATLDLAGMTGVPVAIASATESTATPGGWSACDVKGNIAPQEQFEAFLPLSTWRQLYLQTGCGGFCGTVSISAPQSTGCVPLTSGAFAMASDNEGHYGTTAFDATFGADPQLRADYGYLSEHKLADLMKKLLTVFYGKAPTSSFYDGCSQGGHEGLLEAQQYPHDFNGIVAGAPAAIHQPLNVWYQGWNALANQGPNGQPILTVDKLAPLHAAVVKACGDVNGLIMDPSSCDFDPGTIQCPAGTTDAPSCLTPAQVQTVRKLYAGPRDNHGDLMYPGWQVKGSEANWAAWIVPPAPGAPTSSTIDWNIALNTIRYLAHTNVNPTLGLKDIPFTAAGFRQIMSQTSDIFDATNPDLTAFRNAGGKLILWHGWADPAISPIGTIAYYQAVQDQMGGPAATAQFARLFMLPGVGHCSGGQGPDSFDALSAIVDWVQHGKAPDSFLTAKSPTSTSTVQSLPVYPYPLVATYNGSGDPNLAASYHPAAPTRPFDAHIPWLGSFSTQPPHHR
jgi:hypothetical protein